MKVEELIEILQDEYDDTEVYIAIDSEHCKNLSKVTIEDCCYEDNGEFVLLHFAGIGE